MLEAKHCINGEWTSGSSGQMETRMNPARLSEAVGSFPLAAAADAERAVEAASRALADWRNLSATVKSDILHRAANVLESRAEELAELVSREVGKPIGEARGEVKRGVVLLRYYAGEGLRAVGEMYRASDGKSMLYTNRVPLGVVGVITPWNFPVAIPLWKIAPALIFGNTVVWKPAEPSAITAWRLMEILMEAGLPNGVLNLVIGTGPEIGQYLTAHPAIQGVTFTGSNAVGKQVAATAAARGAKYQLEMGGKNPSIVASDADLHRAADAVISSAMRFAGQKCTATSRVIVEESVARPFTELLTERTKALAMCDPLDERCFLGPVTNERQQQNILAAIERAVRDGARLLAGGKAPGGALADGCFVEPTLFDQVDPGSELARKELFGPVLAIIPAKDLRAALDIANDADFGLSAALFTKDLDRVFPFLEQIEAAHIKINGETAGVEPHAPFGGLKQSSSHSREQGRAAIEFFTSVQTIAVSPST